MKGLMSTAKTAGGATIIAAGAGAGKSMLSGQGIQIPSLGEAGGLFGAAAVMDMAGLPKAVTYAVPAAYEVFKG